MRLWKCVLIVLLLAVCVFAQTTSPSTPVVPQFIRFTSVVPNADGVRVQKAVHFAIYQEKENGAPLWSEDQTVSVAANGSFSVLLGASGEGVPSAIFVAGEARWIALSVDNAEVGPRSLIVSVPYAMKAADADTLGGLPLSAFVTREETSASTSTGTTTTPTSGKLSALATSGFPGTLSPSVAGIGGAGYVPLWMDGAGMLGNSRIFDNGKIGIGTSNPTFSLDVQNSDTSAAGAQLLNMQTPSIYGARIFFNSLATNGRAYGIGSNFIMGLGEFGIYDYTAGTARLVINKSGFMGVGVADPKYSLDIANADTTAAGSSLLQLTTPSRNGAKIVFNSTAASGRSYGFGSNFITGTGEFGIYDYNAGAPRLVVAGTGNVGIGTVTPSATLEVAGNVRISGGGNALVFPDGSTQTSATGAPGTVGVTVTSPDGSITVGGTSTAPTVAVNSVAASKLTGTITDSQIAGVSASKLIGTNSNLFLSTSGNTATTGVKNTAAGFGALQNNSTGSDNTASGATALFYNTTGYNNTATGVESLFFNTTGYGNTATGSAALRSNVSGDENTAAGYSALFSNTTGYSNTATGVRALGSNTIGFDNTATGRSALETNTTGADNTAIGYFALHSNATGNYNTANGNQSLMSNTVGNSNTASGWSALLYSTTGEHNTATGVSSLMSNTTGSFNTALGEEALISNKTGTDNTAVGHQADVTSDNLSNATAIGAFSRVGQSNSIVLGGTASYAVKVGIGTPTPSATLEVVGGVKVSGSGNGITFPDGSKQTAAGASVGTNTFTGNQTINGSLSTTGVVSGSTFNIGSNPFAFGTYVNQNAFLGFAGNSTTTGSQNTGIGSSALGSNTTGNYNTAIGEGALKSNTTGFVNTATGSGALYLNTTGVSNTATGTSALWFNTTGGDNTATGAFALQQNTTGWGNTATGDAALKSNTTGYDNSSTGSSALYSNTTGYHNTAEGASALRSNVTGLRNTAIGAYADVSTDGLMNATAIGADAKVAQSNSLVLGGSGDYAVNVGIGTPAPAYTLDVQGTGNFTGLVKFAPGQTFPGTGTITTINSGAGLTGGPITSNGTLSIANGGIANAMLANPGVNIVAGTGITGGGTVNLGGTVAIANAGVLSVSGIGPIVSSGGTTPVLSLDTMQVPLLASSNAFTAPQTITATGTALTTNGDAKVTGNLTVTGTGGMPLYTVTGVAKSAPHMVTGTTLINGSYSVMLQNAAAFSSATSYSCTVNSNSTTPWAVSVTMDSGTQFTIYGTGGAVSVSFICVGN